MKFKSRASPTLTFWALDVVFVDGLYCSSKVEDATRRAEIEAVLSRHPDVERVEE